MNDYNNKNLSLQNTTLFKSETGQTKEEKIIKDLLDRYIIKDMNEWLDVGADLIITDPPFGIAFSGKNGNYHRNVNNVVDGYVEWNVSEYGEKIQQYYL